MSVTTTPGVGSLSPTGPAVGMRHGNMSHRARALSRSRFSPINPALLVVAASLGLSMLGIAAIATTEPALAQRQAFFLVIAIVGAALLAIPRPAHLRNAAWPVYLVALALLVFVLLPFVPEAIVRPRNGARRWISLGITDFQPSEIAKVGFVLVLAEWLRIRSNYHRLAGLLVPFILTLVPVALILREPDLGTALLFIPALFAMLLAAGARKRHILTIVLAGVVVAPMAYPLLRPHQRTRIDALVAQIRGDPRYEQDIGFQGARAMTLVGAGGVSGVGRAHAEALVTFNRLPEEHNDMIFAVVCCRWGLVGGATAWILFLVHAAGGAATAILCRDAFGRLVAVGFTTIVLAQMTINTGMTIGLLPITGMTLPFVSYGGSSLVAAWAMTGILYGVALRRPRRFEREALRVDPEER